MERIVVLSDLHGMYRDVVVPDGDVLLIAGDLTAYGGVVEYHYLNAWLGTLPHQHKVVVAGNHDRALAETSVDGAHQLLPNAIYLQDETVEIDGIFLYGSPWTPMFMQWYFMQDRGPAIRNKWDQIPDRTDILITHGPPKGYCDWTTYNNYAIGCEELRIAVERVRPKLHVFGHCHNPGFARNQHTLFVNASTCDEAYVPRHPPVVLDWPIELWE